jgi:hypothetical protein
MNSKRYRIGFLASWVVRIATAGQPSFGKVNGDSSSSGSKAFANARSNRDKPGLVHGRVLHGKFCLRLKPKSPMAKRVDIILWNTAASLTLGDGATFCE